jgi:hypothetical protein
MLHRSWVNWTVNCGCGFGCRTQRLISEFVKFEIMKQRSALPGQGGWCVMVVLYSTLVLIFYHNYVERWNCAAAKLTIFCECYWQTTQWKTENATDREIQEHISRPEPYADFLSLFGLAFTSSCSRTSCLPRCFRYVLQRSRVIPNVL